MGLDLFISKVKKTEEEFAYFRKVNFLIPFFEEVSDTEIQNCVPITIRKGWIEELARRCKKILDMLPDDFFDKDNKSFEDSLPPKVKLYAENNLPTQGGFFFGGCTYDGYYAENVKYVYDKCQELLVAFDDLQDHEFFEFSIWY